MRDVERLVTETGLRTPGFRLVKAGATVSDYTTDLSWRPSPFTGVADVPRVLQEFDDGATIVLQGLHHLWLPLVRYCRHLEAYLGHAAQANAYYTPRGSQGLPVHHDTHEVVSLQVAGEKRWLVYEPVLELPLKNQRYRSALGAPGEPVLDVTLRAGDTMYLPRGWLHQALTSGSDSLHVTIGVNVPPLDRRGPRRARDARARPLLPPRRSTASRLRSCPGSTPMRPGSAPATGSCAAGARSSTGSSRSCGRSTARHVDAELVRRDTVIADLHGTRLVFEGKQLRFPERLPASSSSSSRPRRRSAGSDLPGPLDDAGRLVLSGGSCARGSYDVAPGRLSSSVEQVRCVASPSSRRTSTS